MSKIGYKHDALFAGSMQSVEPFVFDEKTVQVFADMIQRSVPGYATMLSGIAAIAFQHAQQKTCCYDLGCSLGAASLALASAVQERDCELIAVDNSEAMIAGCKTNLQQAGLLEHVSLRCADIVDTRISNASIVVLNLTLQFIPLQQRAKCLQAIYDGMLPGGVLILSEKIDFSDAQQAKIQQSIHHGFKQLHGYSALEISQKRSALENVLIPETIETHQQRLNQCGFKFVSVWFQCFNFMSLIAIK